MDNAVGCAEVIQNFARLLVKAAENEPGREFRRQVVDGMLHGNCELLEENYTFEEMFQALDEHIAERHVGEKVRAVSDNLKSIRGRKRFFW